jgi:hypothetical protein
MRGVCAEPIAPIVFYLLAWAELERVIGRAPGFQAQFAVDLHESIHPAGASDICGGW